jgi:hypothetical protein
LAVAKAASTNIARAWLHARVKAEVAHEFLWRGEAVDVADRRDKTGHHGHVDAGDGQKISSGTRPRARPISGIVALVPVRAIGEVDGTVLSVVYTDRGETRRIILARLANERERSTWQSFAKL